MKSVTIAPADVSKRPSNQQQPHPSQPSQQPQPQPIKQQTHPQPSPQQQRTPIITEPLPTLSSRLSPLPSSIPSKIVTTSDPDNESNSSSLELVYRNSPLPNRINYPNRDRVDRVSALNNSIVYNNNASPSPHTCGTPILHAQSDGSPSVNTSTPNLARIRISDRGNIVNAGNVVIEVPVTAGVSAVAGGGSVGLSNSNFNLGSNKTIVVGSGTELNVTRNNNNLVKKVGMMLNDAMPRRSRRRSKIPDGDILRFVYVMFVDLKFSVGLFLTRLQSVNTLLYLDR
ncbi:hypothetical protein HDU76_006250 [Blyttiomyces sp. JEL0837]|nr:hypothetical protein HDU76_006250 [Blyttiomyces sp. JEL0837]